MVWIILLLILGAVFAAVPILAGYLMRRMFTGFWGAD